MTPHEFIERWQSNQRGERSAAQSFFNDLCDLVAIPRPNDDPRTQFVYAFEEPVALTNGRKGYADVSWYGRFAAEFKRPGESLDAALTQLVGYAAELGSPPVLLVSDRLQIRVHTRFNGEPPRRWDFLLAELADFDKLAIVRAALRDPLSLRSQSADSRVAVAANPVYVPPAPTATFDVLADSRRATTFLRKCAKALHGLSIGGAGSRSYLPSASREGRDAIVDFLSYRYRGIPDAERSMHPVIKEIQRDTVDNLIELAAQVQLFQFEAHSERYWLTGDDALTVHASMWDLICSVRGSLTRMAEQLRAING